MKTIRHIAFTLPLLFSCGTSAAGETTTQEMRANCEAERQKLLAPLREQEIQKCLKERNSKEYCDRFYADFGESGRTASGGFRQRMFDDIPECVIAREAEENERLKTRDKGEGKRDTAAGKTRDSTASSKSRDTDSGKKRDSSTGTNTRDTDNKR